MFFFPTSRVFYDHDDQDCISMKKTSQDSIKTGSPVKET